MTELRIEHTRLRFVRGDITEVESAAIVNAANPALKGGGGVDGAIHRKGGPEILAECLRLRATLYPDGLPTGAAATTTAGALRARRVIHTVGPVWRGGTHGEHALLARAYRSCLEVALEEGLESVAFPSISTGVYGFPLAEAAPVAVGAVIEYLHEHAGAFTEVRFVLFTEPDLRGYESAAAALAASADRA